MHVIFLLVRISLHAVSSGMVGNNRFNFVALLTACALLPTVFHCRPTIAWLREHRDVWFLVSLCASFAALEVGSVYWMGSHRAARSYNAHRRNRLLSDDIMSTG